MWESPMRQNLQTHPPKCPLPCVKVLGFPQQGLDLGVMDPPYLSTHSPWGAPDSYLGSQKLGLQPFLFLMLHNRRPLLSYRRGPLAFMLSFHLLGPCGPFPSVGQ